MNSKIDAFLNRKEIRDVFDMEFLIKKGTQVSITKEKANKIIYFIDKFSKNDYTVKLGSILDTKDRKYYIKENFKLLKSRI